MPSANQVRDTSSEAHPLKSVEDMSPPPTTGNGTGTSMDSSVTSLNPAVARRKSKFSTEDDDDDDNVKDLLVYYAKNSTMHGIPTIVGSELYRGRHIFWIIVVCVMAIFLGTVIYWQMSDYYDYPTVT
ncbi:degenerin unc-8, partial [Plakobranchus ocellatus]